MNLHVFCILMSIMLLLHDALSKTLPGTGAIDSEQPEDHENPDETEAVHEAQHHSLKRQRDSHHAKGHQRSRRAENESFSKKKPCAVMYKNGEPIGVLQPYKDNSYQLLPIHSDEKIPVDISPMERAAQKRDASDDDESADKNEQNFEAFADEKYPYIFAKFKIDSKVEKDGTQKTKSLAKRESFKNPSLLFNEKHVKSLKSTLSRIETNNNDQGAETELRGILNDMGLIDDTPIEKRDAELVEDEDLEHGTNKINLIQVENEITSNNKEKPIKRESSRRKIKKLKSAAKRYEMIDFPEPRTINEDEYIDQYMKKHPDEFKERRGNNDDKERAERSDDDDLQHQAKEPNEKAGSEDAAQQMKEPIKEPAENLVEREKRSEDNPDAQPVLETKKQIKERTDNNLEPEKSSEDAAAQQTKDQIKEGASDENLMVVERDKRSEDVAAQQMEKQIKERLQKIKEEVKNEIESLKSNGNLEDVEGEEESGQEQESKSQRQKRHVVDTLVDEETSDLDPVLFGENNLTPHIRRRRSLDDKDDGGSAGSKNDANKAKADQKKALEGSTDDSDETSLIIDLNPDVTNEKITERNLHLAFTTSPNQHVATTTTMGYLTRNLKESEEEPSNQNDQEEDEDFDDTNPVARRKKACKCNGKDCKCKGQPKAVEASDGSSFVYFDDAPMRISGIPHDANDVSSDLVNLHFLPRSNKDSKRPSREEEKHGEKMSRIQTRILQGFRDGGYTLDLKPDIYRITEEQNPSVRGKRNSLLDLVAIHGGAPVLDHLVAVRERSMLPGMSTNRVKRSSWAKEGEQQLTLTDMSEEDLFGALPQSYEGELARYKRVKRA